ncbi:MAG: helicase-related protein [Opitutaceae bacterium]|jgi:superfamily II DNA or RNA helicase
MNHSARLAAIAAELRELEQHRVGLLAEQADLLSRESTLHRLDGSTARRERAAILADTGQGFVLFATASLLGEGFDLPRLDTLFLTTPVSFSGRVIQYAGRLHRSHAAKTDVRIYDYHEPAHRLSAHMHRKRVATLRTLGYVSDENTPPTSLVFL